MSSVLVGIVGRAPASIVLAARALRPDRTLLVHSEDTEKVADVVRGQLGGEVTHVLADATRLEPTARAVAAKLASLPGTTRLFVDLTGGTKPLSIGVWEGTRELATALGPAHRSVVYLSAAGALLDAGSGTRVESAEAVAIEPAEAIAWVRPLAQVRSVWRGGPEDVRSEIFERAEVWRLLAQAITDKTWQSTPDIQRTFTPRTRPSRLPPGFRFVKDGIEVPLAYLTQNVWLEELALAEVAAATRFPGVRIAHGVTVVSPGAGNVELDLVATRGARALVVEAKTVGSSPGGQLSKKAAHVGELLGPTARLLAFVPKVFGRDPAAVRSRADIDANLGRAGCVCASIEDLGRLARAHLGG